MALRTLPIRRAGNRHNLFLGGDRELVMLAGLLSFTLIVAAQDAAATLAGVLLWVSSVYACRRMAQRDPKLRSVYLRHRRYCRYYPARSTPFRQNGPIQAGRYR
jgi:type IV secretory pathway TrbD component